MARRIIDWQEVCDAPLALVGAKARNLALARRWGFDVPWMFVIPPDETAPPPEMEDHFDRIDSLSDAAIAEGEADAALDALRHTVEQLTTSDELVEAVAGQLVRFVGTQLRYAVRSSVSVEDGAVHSFAGMFASVLDCETPGDVVAATAQCRSSPFTRSTVLYARRAGVALRDLRAAVLVCEMVGGRDAKGQTTPAAAGIAFTTDPVTNAWGRIRVEAVAGLADRLASGKEGGTSYLLPLAPGAPVRPPLTPFQLAQLGRLCGRLRDAFGDVDRRIDVEWVFDGSIFHVVQVRPDTTPARASLSSSVDFPNIWSNTNLAEVLPGVPTPLTWSVLRPNTEWGMLEAQRVVGYKGPIDLRVVERFGGRAYFNTAALEWLNYDAFGIPPGETAHDMGGAQPSLPLPAKGAMTRAQRRNRLRILRVLLRLPRTMPRHAAAAEALWQASTVERLTALPPAKLAAMWEETERALAELPLLLASTLGKMWSGFARQALPRTLRDRSADLIGASMAGSGEVSSAEHAHALHALAAGATAPDWASRVQKFADRFGHRGFGEMELANPRWGETLDALISDLGGPHDRSAPRDRPVQVEALRSLAALSPIRRRMVRWLIRRAAKGYALREEAKSIKVRLLGVLRRIALETGDRVACRAFTRVEDVFMLGRDDVIAFLLGEWNGYGALARTADAAERLAALRAQAAPPDVLLDGPVPAVDADPGPYRQASESAQGGISGLAVSPGVAEGVVRPLAQPDVTARLSEGDVVVASAVDPGWTPLLLRASALVTEHGGYLSHVSIVARELGIPAVMNLGPSIRTLAAGQRVRVDGSRGTVTVLEEAQGAEVAGS